MGIYIGKDLTGRLVTRFNLKAIPAFSTSWELKNTVQPVSNADRLFSQFKFVLAPDITVTATGWQLLVLSPPGKLRRLIALHSTPISGDFLSSQFGLGESSTEYVQIKQFTGASDGYLFPSDIPGGLWLRPGLNIYVSVASFTSTGVLRTRLICEEEDEF